MSSTDLTAIPPQRSRSGSRSRSSSKNRTQPNSRSSSGTRRPSLSGRRSLSSSSLTKLTVTQTNIDTDRSIPTVDITLDNSLPLDFFKQDLLALIKALRISKWHKRQLTVSNLIVNRISGALTNSIYKLEYFDHQQNLRLPSLLLRVYGKNVDELIDRESELKTLIKLSSKRIGPRLLGIFTNGRFEQFLEGFITLGKKDIRDQIISQMLGRRMKDLHYKIELSHEDLNSLPMSWRLIIKWLDLYEQEYLPIHLKSEYDPTDVFFVEFQKFKQLVFQYKDWLFSKYDQSSFSSNYKFCHNDTQYGNLLLHESFDRQDIINDDQHNDEDTAITVTSNKKDSNLVVIDFEYSGSNFPALDIVNHFSEWMSDYHDEKQSYYIHNENYPSQVEQLNLIKSYIEYDFQFPSTNLITNTQISLDQQNISASDLIEFEIKKLYNECIYWRATVQIYWCLWGLIQNGPVKIPSLTSNSTVEKGVDGTYTITTNGIENLSINDNDVAVEEAISSSDDDFDYLKYSQQKIALVMGDLIQFGFLSKDDIDEKYHSIIKVLDTKLYDI
ncbi:choline kinase [Scheffersomyces coipomensis]|uniref:choline kinase n=1 Tax=Scheffersomyces coipomensis TaxID=1788519 RepID=UPI00315DE698